MCTEMRKEIGQRHMEAKNLKEDLEQKNRGINIESKQLEELVEQVESLKVGGHLEYFRIFYFIAPYT